LHHRDLRPNNGGFWHPVASFWIAFGLQVVHSNVPLLLLGRDSGLLCGTMGAGLFLTYADRIRNGTAVDARFMSPADHTDRRLSGAFDDEQVPRGSSHRRLDSFAPWKSSPIKYVLDRSIDTYISVAMGQMLAQGT